MLFKKCLLVVLSTLILSACGGGGSGGSDNKDDTPPEPQLTYYSSFSSEVGQCSHVAIEDSEMAAQWIGAGGTIGKCPTTDAIAYCADIPADPSLDFQIYYYDGIQVDQAILAQGCEHLGGIFTKYEGTQSETDTDENGRPNGLQPLLEIAGANEFQNFVDVSYLSHGIVWDIEREELVEINGGESFPIYDTYVDVSDKKLKSIMWQDNPEDQLGTPISIFDYSSGQFNKVSNRSWRSGDVCVDVYWYGSGNALVSTKSGPFDSCWTGEVYLVSEGTPSDIPPIKVSFGKEWYENRLTATIKNQNGKLEGVLLNRYANTPNIYLYENGAFNSYSLNIDNTSTAEVKALGVINSEFLFYRDSKIFKLSREEIKNNTIAADISHNFEDLSRLTRGTQLISRTLGDETIYLLDLFIEGAYHNDIYTVSDDGTFIKRARVKYRSQLSIYKTGNYYVVASIGNSPSIPIHFQFFNNNWEPTIENNFYRNLASSSSCIIQIEDSIALYDGSSVSILKETLLSEAIPNSYLIQLSSAVRGENILHKKNKLLSVNTHNGVVRRLDDDGVWSEIGIVSMKGNPAKGNCASGRGVYLGEKFVVTPNGSSHGIIYGKLDGEINILPQYSM